MEREGEKRIKSKDLNESALRWYAYTTPRGMAIFLILVGLLLVFAPDYWFGPTWWYFQDIPHGGFGIGLTCLGLGSTLSIAVWRKSKRFKALILFLAGIAFWVAAFVLAAQGMLGRTGLMESPFMMYIGGDMLMQSAVLRR
jgi:hypothetical protein